MIRFKWEKIGRSYVARFGRLSVVVSGSTAKGWRVRSVFGDQFSGSGIKYSLHEVLAEAELIALNHMKDLVRLRNEGPAASKPVVRKRRGKKA